MSEQYKGWINKYAKQYGLDPAILHKMFFQESSFNHLAEGEMTSAGVAKGLAQALDSTAKDPGYGVTALADVFDPEDSIRFGGEYLAAMLDKFGDYPMAIAAYHAGPGNGDKHGTELLTNRERFPKTSTHVDKVLGVADENGIRPMLYPFTKKSQIASLEAQNGAIDGDLNSVFPPAQAGSEAKILAANNPQPMPLPDKGNYSGIVSAAPKDANTVPQTGIMNGILNFFGFGDDAADENASLEADAASLAEISASLAEKGISDPDGQFAGELFKARKSQDSSGNNVDAVRQGLGMLASGFQGPSFQEVPQLAQVSQARGRGSDPMSNFGTKSMLG